MESPLPPRLQDLLSQLSRVPAELEHELKYLLQAPPSAPDARVAPPSDEVAQAEHKLTELWQEIQQADAELKQLTLKHDEKVQDLADLEDAIGRADAQHKSITAESAAAAVQIQRLAEEQQRIEFHRTQAQELAAAVEAAKAETDAREHSLATREFEVSLREQETSKRGEWLAATRHWLESLLPVWLQEEQIAPWRDALLDDAQHPRTASNAAGLLFANLSLYTYAHKDTDARAVADALRDVSRRLFAWLKERNVSDYDASAVAQSWAEQINRECAGRCEIEVPVPGSPAQSQTMLYQPRPGVSAQSVLTVQSWCVRGAKREVIHRANVTV
ncbi:MAG: hypothetical protein U1F81_04440 [Verrucomicrobiaceae bacterium]